MVPTKRKTAIEESSNKKRQKIDLPIHGRRLVIAVMLSWINHEGNVQETTGKMLVDSGATGPIMSRQFV